MVKWIGLLCFDVSCVTCVRAGCVDLNVDEWIGVDVLDVVEWIGVDDLDVVE